MDKKYYNKLLKEGFKNDGFKNLKPELKYEFIGFKKYTIVEIEDLQIMFNHSWIGKYTKHYTHWGYDKDVEFVNIAIRAYCVLIGQPKENTKDLPFDTGIRRLMIDENILIGIKFRRRVQDLFGDNWSKIQEISGPEAKLVYAFSSY